ncbi:MAG TPA: hypothetical protein VK601_19440, partial [Kofleriaceae bacterium]|nr:hypothetical protein [Kofleriaceae bacterium]
MSHSIGWWVGIGLAVLGACGSDPNQGPESSEPPLLTRRDVEPPGARCEFGGTAVHAGLDRNRNGSLDDAEVTHTEYLCNPANRVIVRKDPQGPSQACPGGGVAVLTGVDDNGD